MKRRIWELDALRGLCILGMVAVHFVYDLVELYGLASWEYPAVFSFIKEWGGVLFILISGVCATLGSRCVRRGLTVFGCGLLCTAVTAGMYLLNLASPDIIIWFGILHCLGSCMLLWALLKRLPTLPLGLLGAVLVLTGLRLQTVSVTVPFLFPLGLRTQNFSSADYFPLLPYLGFFLLGAVLGRTLYREKKTLLPKADPSVLPIRFLSACGRKSLFIYLLHQPVMTLQYTVLTKHLH